MCRGKRLSQKIGRVFRYSAVLLSYDLAGDALFHGEKKKRMRLKAEVALSKYHPSQRRSSKIRPYMPMVRSFLRE